MLSVISKSSFMQFRAALLVTQLLALLMCAPIARAQTTPPDEVRPVFTQQELDQMLAPIALYPDSLLSQILMASTYPIEIVQAARWSKANPNLTGDDAVKVAEQNNWDPSVESLVAFPQILAMLDEKLGWTVRLGDAFLSQERQVMDTVQALREKAQAAGNLKSIDQLRVDPQGTTIVIEQTNPQVVYVPYYNPTLVYGAWWWPDHPPVYWAPWPGYYERPGFGAGFLWGAGTTLGAEFFFGAFDWPDRHVRIVNVDHHRPRPHFGNGPPGSWQHDPGHRRGVAYRDPVLGQQFGRHDNNPDGRREYRGNEPNRGRGPSNPGTRPDMRSDTGNLSQHKRTEPRVDGSVRPNAPEVGSREPRRFPERPNVGAAPPRPNVPNSGATPPRLSVPNSVTTPPHPVSIRPPVLSPVPGVVGRPIRELRPQIFEGVGQGNATRDSSVRGRDSSQQMAPPRPTMPVPSAVPVPRQNNDAAPGRATAGGGRGGEPSARPQR